MMIEQRNVVKYVLPIILLSFMVTGCSCLKKETELLSFRGTKANTVFYYGSAEGNIIKKLKIVQQLEFLQKQ